MPFLDTIITAAKNIEGLQAKIDKALHPQYYYKKERDVPIIEQVRAIFSASFKGRPLPVELQYKHEYDRPTDTSSAPTEPSEYQPPFFLAKKLSVGVQFAIGNNSISDQCRSVIITIQTYIDALNECAGKATNKLPHVHYGHESDSIRFVFLLIINAFTALSGKPPIFN
ncbi:MAG: hypothetical protein Q8R79_04845 [Legionellaceae bacterium]|nr:hypothetical protein [Legionellaceae bacterium]